MWPVGKVFIKALTAKPGEVECCTECMKFRQADPAPSPTEVVANHLERHVEWTHLGTCSDITFRPAE